MSRAGQQVLTERDVQIVQWVYGARLATRDQIQRLFFTAAGKSRCQERLTALFQHRYLDRLPNRFANEPGVYLISRHATRGLQLLRTLLPDQSVAPFRVASARVQHILDIASVRAVCTNATKASDVQLLFWVNEENLADRIGSFGIIPDAYFQVSRNIGDGERRSGFFVEVERSAKSKRALEERFRRYADFYYGGGYERLFGTRALRLLFVVGSDYNLSPRRHIALCRGICERLHFTVARFTTLDDLLNLPPDQVLTARLWQQPENPTPVSLY